MRQLEKVAHRFPLDRWAEATSMFRPDFAPQNETLGFGRR